MNSRERNSLDRYITGHYGEDQFEAVFEAEMDRLLTLRHKAIMENNADQLIHAEKMLDDLAPDWREWI